MFRGSFDHAIDDKGRIAIPAKFRDQLQAADPEMTLIVTTVNQCAVAFPLLEWQALETKFTKMAQADARAQAFVRYVVAMAHECPLDKTGRILLPQTIRDIAQIDRDVTVIGQINKIEIWSRARWNRFRHDMESQAQDIAAEIAHLGIAV